MLRSFIMAYCVASVAATCLAQPSQITVDANVVLNKIPATLYGSCIEDVNHEIYGGLYDQRIVGESFEEPASGVDYAHWTKHGGYWAADREYSDGSVSMVPGRRTRRMVARNDLEVEPDRHAKLVYQTTDLTDGLIEVSMRFLQERGTGASILLRVTNVGIGENALTGYEVRFNREDKKLQLIKHQSDFKLLIEQPIILSPDGWHQLRIELSGSRITVYLNGAPRPTLTFTDTETPIQKGKLGIGTAGSPVSFKNVHLTTGSKTQPLPLVYPADQQVSDRWDPVQSGTVTARFLLEQGHAFNGLTAQSVEWVSGSGRVGLANRSLNRWGIAVKKGQSLTGSCYLRVASGTVPVTIALERADGSQSYARQTLAVGNTAWKNTPSRWSPV